MGGKQSKQILEEYCKSQRSLSQSQDVRYIKQLFACYDKKKKGYLDERQALQFIDDVLSVSGIKIEIHKNTPDGSDPGKFYKDTIKELFTELDTKKQGRLEQDDLLAARITRAHSLLEDVEEALQRLNKIRRKLEKSQRKTDCSTSESISKSLSSGSFVDLGSTMTGSNTTATSGVTSSTTPAVAITTTTATITVTTTANTTTTTTMSTILPTTTTTVSSSTSAYTGGKWEWKDGTLWKAYDLETTKILELAYVSGQTFLTLTNGIFGSQGGYDVNLTTMKQKRNTTGFERDLRRIFPPAATPNASLTTTVTTPTSSSRTSGSNNSGIQPYWEYLNKAGTWEKYDRISNVMLEGSAKQGRLNVTLSHPPWNKCGGVLVDFIKMEHTPIKSDSDASAIACRRTPPLTGVKSTPTPTSSPTLLTEEKKLILCTIDEAFVKATGAKKVTYADLPSGECCPICLDLLDDNEDDDRKESEGDDKATNREPSPEVIHMKSCIGHYFHTECIFPIWKRGYLICPICQNTYGVRVGNMPLGNMKVEFTNTPLNGVTNAKGSIVIQYSFSPGVQSAEHMHPGSSYEGTSRTCYLPDNDEGKEVLRLLKLAWGNSEEMANINRTLERKLTFTIGTSMTTGKDNQVIWNGIHHKTTRGAGSHGWPDSGYIARVTDELKRFGVE